MRFMLRRVEACAGVLGEVVLIGFYICGTRGGYVVLRELPILYNHVGTCRYRIILLSLSLESKSGLFATRYLHY